MSHTPTLDFEGAALAAAGCQGAAESEAVYRADLNAQYAEVVAERDALKAALQWYANPDNYAKDDWGVESVIQSPEYGNPGNIARKALARLDGKEGK